MEASRESEQEHGGPRAREAKGRWSIIAQTKKGLTIIEHMLAGEQRRQRQRDALREAVAEQHVLAQELFERDVAAAGHELLWTGPMAFEVVPP